MSMAPACECPPEITNAHLTHGYDAICLETSPRADLAEF